jgi:hypothetical protein
MMVNGNFNFDNDAGNVGGGGLTGLTNASLDLTIANIFTVNVTLIDSASMSLTTDIAVARKLF